MYNLLVAEGQALLLFSLTSLSLCSYHNTVKQFDVQPLSNDDIVSALRTVGNHMHRMVEVKIFRKERFTSKRTSLTLPTLQDLDDELECIYPTDCNDLMGCGRKKSGVYRVFPLGLGDGFLVYCDMKTEDGGWLVNAMFKFMWLYSWGWSLFLTDIASNNFENLRFRFNVEVDDSSTPDRGFPYEDASLCMLHCPISIEQRHISFGNIDAISSIDVLLNGLRVFQRRQDGSVEFYRNWKTYTNGFGNLLGEFWLGLEKLHLLTSQRRYELLVNLGSYDNGTRYARYDRFYISDESHQFQLLLGSYSGDAGDSLKAHNGYKFSTFDMDNDSHGCAKSYKAGWWYVSCLHANLNGPYVSAANQTNNNPTSASWFHWTNSHKSMQIVEMKLRPFL